MNKFQLGAYTLQDEEETIWMMWLILTISWIGFTCINAKIWGEKRKKKLDISNSKIMFSMINNAE